MARIEGTGIKTPSKKSMRLAGNLGPSTPVRIDKVTTGSGSTFKRVLPDFGAGRIGEVRLKKAEADIKRPNYFSPGGGAFDERNNVQVASADLSSLDVGNSFTKQADKNIASASTATSEGFNQFIQKDFGISTDSRTYKSFPDHIKGDLKDQYRDSLKFKEGTQINQAPVKEKPSLLERTANFAGSIFNTVTGTQPATASQIPGGMPDASKASTGDTSFASYRMAGGGQQQQEKTVVNPTVKPQYEINRAENRPSVGGTAGTGDTSFSAYVRGGGEGQQRGIVSPVSTGAPRQTVASLPSNYKSTEAEAFRKASAFKEAQGIAKRNPNVSVGVDSKGQPRATATNDSGVARAQAMAVNRKLSGRSISQTKAANKASMQKKAEARHATFKKTGKSTVSARRAAAKKANQAAAKKRHSAFKKKRAAKRKKKSKKK